ncbi:uncharacterized protein EV154DRAFT_571379 [Mucor mucedo]|uniref:uncharacterized protein n=1 Tax=Mucor mucedo TaxID=29922 RepID=UPI00221F9794|nr:uncharacterized protein EV154DRAFT_571379 [Mucor mucedo]KAI7868389.1 hypothetical protein EV154DRAFT_571379 [Mucor mucedo]
MEQQNVFKQTEKITKRQYTKGGMYHIAELYGRYYLGINTHNNILSPNRVQINNQHWKALTFCYNERQDLLPNNEGYFRTDKALLKKYGAMKTKYQNKKETNTSTGEQKKKRKSVKEEKEPAQVKSRVEALEQMKQITEGMTSKLEEIMSKPLVVEHVESEEKKQFYKTFLELMENGL